MKLSPRQALPVSRPAAHRSATVLMGTMLAALCLSLSGCSGQTEWTPPGYTIYNYSSSSYVARIIHTSGTDDYIVVPPESSVGNSGGYDPVKAVVYDGSCLTTLATVTVTAPFAVIYIDEDGHVFASKPKGPLSSAEPPDGRVGRIPAPVPAACFGLHAEPTKS